MKIIALGRTKMLLNSIRMLSNFGHEIVLIGTCTNVPEYDVEPNDFLKLANEIGADFFCDAKINSEEILDKINRAQADIAISVNWINVIGEEVLSIFPFGILNAHAGDLPKYKGNAVVNWAILNNEKEICISIHKMVPELDSGPILMKKYMKINNDTTVGDIYKYLEEEVPTMFCDTIQKIEIDQINEQVQSQKDTLRCYPRIPYDSLINWQDSAENIDKLIRASSKPFSGAYTYLNGEKIIIWKASVEKNTQNSLVIPGQVLEVNKEEKIVKIATGRDILKIYEVQFVNRDEVSPTEVIKSLRTRLGLRIEEEYDKLQKKIQVLEKQVLKLEKLLEV